MRDILYYEAPTDEIFNDIKLNAIRIWKTYDDTYGYSSKKVDRIKDIQNIENNVMYIVAMFDIQNQKKLLTMVRAETGWAIVERIKSGGGSVDYLINSSEDSQ